LTPGDADIAKVVDEIAPRVCRSRRLNDKGDDLPVFAALQEINSERHLFGRTEPFDARDQLAFVLNIGEMCELRHI